MNKDRKESQPGDEDSNKVETVKHKFKKDRYVNARGGSSEFLDIYCSSCNGHLALYQKDGPGGLLRMYLDRIFEPGELSSLQDSNTSIPALKCPSCHQLVATPMVYKLEDRPALRLIRGTYYKKKSNGTYPPPKR